MSQEIVIAPPGTLTVATGDGMAVPRILGDAGDRAARRFLEFFATIRNRNTRSAYYTACMRFFAWCGQHRIGGIDDIELLHVAAYIEVLGEDFEKPTVKQHLAAVRMLFDAGNGPGHRHEPGACRARAEACRQDRQDNRAGRRRGADASGQHRPFNRRRSARPGADRPHDYRFARIRAAVAMNVEDYHARGKRWWAAPA